MLSSLPPLPIDDALPALRAALEAGPYAVLVAPPGAGKTTRVPLALLDAPWRADRRIIMLEPRRLAARAAAGQMARLLGENVGETVGYRVRMDSKISGRTRVEIATEGVFTRMLLDDPELTGTAAVLFDEFHERSLDGDLGLALALDAAALRPDLRILVMSATIDGARVARLLHDAPVIESLGRAFPVETLYREPDALQRLDDQVTAAVLAALREHEGSALVFLPGQGEITRVAERLASRVAGNVDIAPLYGQLAPAEQDRAIRPAEPSRRKVVLATSIAETSLTIDGVRIVVDSGFRRIPVYEPGTGLTTLATARVSRAGADQRRGRAGRTSPGIAIRLWNEGQNSALEAFDTPEILAADLAGFALDLANWGVTDPKALPFLDPPPAPAWNEAVALLKSLDAIDDAGRITGHGKSLSRLALHPRLAHMIVSAEGDSDTAAELAVLMTERGLGGDSVDMSHRLDRFRSDRSKRADEARSLARRWSKLSGQQTTGKTAASLHLARAFPDRIAQSAGPRGKFRLANGRQASLDQTEALASAQYLVVTDMTGTAANGRIRSAVEIDRTTIEELYAHHITEAENLSFDVQSGSVRARKTRQLNALRLSDEPIAISNPEAAAHLLAQAAARTGLDSLPWSRDQKAWRARANFLRFTIGDDWPDLTAEALASTVDQWLAPALFGLTKLNEINGEHLRTALDLLLPYPRRQEIEALLPSHFTAPTGNAVPIDYTAEGGPAIEIRVQELFGLTRHPTIANGRIRLILILLSPAHRPIQTTRDLTGFWAGSWADVAKELKGRYPRHPWPDEPARAAPTARAKPRGT